MRTNKPTKLDLLAVHEAGHAVLCAALGAPPDLVRLDLERGSGQVSGPGFQFGDSPLTLRLELVVLAAGGAAERRLLEGAQAGDDEDLRKMRREAQRLHGTVAVGPVIEDEIAAAGAVADALVERHWDEILDTADFLLRFTRKLGRTTKAPVTAMMKLYEVSLPPSLRGADYFTPANARHPFDVDAK